MPGLVAATTRPPSAAPAIQLAFWPRRRIAFAGWSIAGGTVCGTIPVAAGKKNAELSAVDGGERATVPDLGLTGQQEHARSRPG